jgi:hypothetical protein
LFNRSIKYIILLILNIVVLISLYQSSDDGDAGVFDTQFVINLLEERDELQMSVIDMELALEQVESKITETEEMLNIAEREISVRGRQFQRCEAARTAAVVLANEQAVQLDQPAAGMPVSNCNESTAKLRFARQELASTNAELTELKATNQDLRREIDDAKAQDQERLTLELEALKAQNAQLKQDIENPIYLKSAYLSGRKCEQPRFEELVCLTELLVRPMFSKAPTSEVVVTVYDLNERVVAQATFASKRAQLFRMPLGRGKEVFAGEFSATFEVEGELLASTGHSITR